MTNSILIFYSSKLHNYCLPLDLSYFNILFHIQIATRFSFAPISNSFVCDLYQSGPFRLSNAFCQSMKRAHNSSSVPKIRCDITLSILLPFNIKTHFLHMYPQFPFLPSSKYPRYNLCSICHETECVIVAAFCTLCLLLKDTHCDTGPQSVLSMLLNSPVTILRSLSPLHTAKFKCNYLMYLPLIQFRLLVFCSIKLIAYI